MVWCSKQNPLNKNMLYLTQSSFLSLGGVWFVEMNSWKTNFHVFLHGVENGKFISHFDMYLFYFTCSVCRGIVNKICLLFQLYLEICKKENVKEYDHK